MTVATATGPRMNGAPGAAPGTTLTYVYAFLPAHSPAATDLRDGRMEGIDRAPVHATQAGDLIAAVSDVPASEFDEAPLNHLMQSLEWLGPRASAHQQVNAQLFALCDTLLPLAFGTIYRTADAVSRVLVENRHTLEAKLAALHGKAEWVLTVRRDEQRVRTAVDRESVALRALTHEIAATTPGRAYLLRRRAADVHREETERFDRQAVAAVDGLLAQLEARVHPERVPTDAEATRAGAPAGAGRVTLRASALVRREAAGELAAQVERFNQEWGPRGYSLDCTGPWPPYRFAGLASDAAEPPEQRP